MQSSLFLSGLLARSRYDSLPVPTQLFWSRAGILPRMLEPQFGAIFAESSCISVCIATGNEYQMKGIILCVASVVIWI